MEDLITAIADLQEEKALEITRKRLAGGDEPLKILEDARSALEMVGQKFEKCEYFIPDLVYSGEILKGVSELVKPKLTGEARVKRVGKYVLGTVAGDIHDIGKDIVGFMLDISGFEVVDLGVDVPAGKFVSAIRETGAPIVGLSGFLTLAFESMKETVDAIREAGLRDRVKIMIGGGQINDDIRKYSGADAYRPDAVAAVSLAKEWLKTS
ncbi:MAG: cobalamin B12-binding domain-containing protein [Chloroflexi bacterium]|nr:cobalamin B12-binding domain-containing protein [Chloroflexota bacterium]